MIFPQLEILSRLNRGPACGQEARQDFYFTGPARLGARQDFFFAGPAGPRARQDFFTRPGIQARAGQGRTFVSQNAKFPLVFHHFC